MSVCLSGPPADIECPPSAALGLCRVVGYPRDCPRNCRCLCTKNHNTQKTLISSDTSRDVGGKQFLLGKAYTYLRFATILQRISEAVLCVILACAWMIKQSKILPIFSVFLAKIKCSIYSFRWSFAPRNSILSRPFGFLSTRERHATFWPRFRVLCTVLWADIKILLNLSLHKYDPVWKVIVISSYPADRNLWLLKDTLGYVFTQ